MKASWKLTLLVLGVALFGFTFVRSGPGNVLRGLEAGLARRALEIPFEAGYFTWRRTLPCMDRSGCTDRERN
jgi:hypothetical protein